jgi:meso-butanediol dehydrogenase/(S,S)-butanediol dehydrogenase/diacetyl reductase
MNKIIVITGGGSGLGRAMARRLAADGHRLVLLGRRLDKVTQVAGEIGAGATALECDVADPASVDAAFAAIAAKFPSIDVLINNAGTFAPFFVRDATNAQIAAALGTNLAGPVYCVRAAIPLMRRGSQIINVGSETVASRVAMFSLYQASKAGLERFTEALNQELADDGIRVTLLRAGKMLDADYRWDIDPEAAQRFSQENLKRGINQRQEPYSSFASVAEVLPALIDMPADLSVPVVHLEGRRG